jgi:molecular chaperone Hsp33
MSTQAATKLTDDCVQPFMIDATGVNGRMVRLGSAIDDILARHDYPDVVKQLLGEFLALGAGLAAALKYEGVFTLQTKGDGPVPLMVADVTADGAVRGYAQVTGETPSPQAIGDAPIPKLLGDGYLAFTVDQGQDMELYQGIVELSGGTLEDCVHHYFEQSDQFSSAIKLSAGTARDGTWRAASLSVQRLPDEGGTGAKAREESEDDWRRAVTLMATAKQGELLDPELTPDQMLFRLFHEDGVRVFDPRPLVDRCRCSRDRSGRMLVALGRDEISDLKLDDGTVEVTCQFCSRSEHFTDGDLDTVEAQVKAEETNP